MGKKDEYRFNLAFESLSLVIGVPPCWTLQQNGSA